jgi:hypothetical protein
MNTLTCNLPQWTLINTLQPLDGSIVHQCTSNHKIQPLMAPTCINASLHTQNALNQLKSNALWIECAQIHLNDSNQDLQCWNVHTCTSNASKYLQRAPIQHLCTSKLQMVSKTSKLLQSSSKLLQGSKSASNSANLHLQHTQTLKISLNAHKQSNL